MNFLLLFSQLADIVQFVFGSGPHVIAITTEGHLYSWGHNGYGQLGQGVSITIGQGSTPERIRGVLEGIRIVKVACGGHHTLALTQAGEVSVTYQRFDLIILSHPGEMFLVKFGDLVWILFPRTPQLLNTVCKNFPCLGTVKCLPSQ